MGGVKPHKILILKIVTRSCDKSGLRVSDLASMNVAFLAKWLYRYANDNNYMWRRIVCAKNGSDRIKCFQPSFSLVEDSLFSILITTMMGRNSQASNLISQGFRALIGNRTSANFRFDN